MTIPFAGKTILAPLTKGGNLPFRRLCVELGAEITMSEMAYARQVVRGGRSELALLRKHASEPFFGVQLAANSAKDAVAAGKRAVERGCAFVDINAGCPIHDVVKRGMGATMMRRPEVLVEIVERLVEELAVPITVKLRSGWSEDEDNAVELGQQVVAAGASAVALHARARDQRYTKSADWSLIARLVAACPTVPVVGNGDILTWYEAEDRTVASNCAAVMIGRGALIKPWLFREIRDREDWLPTVGERIEVYHRLAVLMKEHFRDDEKGRDRTMRFLPWHVGFFCRYQPTPAAECRERSREHPLLQTRNSARPSDDPLENLLRDTRAEVHRRVAEELWDATDSGDAARRLTAAAADFPPDVGEHRVVKTAHG